VLFALGLGVWCSLLIYRQRSHLIHLFAFDTFVVLYSPKQGSRDPDTNLIDPSFEKQQLTMTYNSDEEPATVVIAGGGIVGLVLAMSLKKQLGIVPEIYEKTSTFGGEAGAGLGMYPNGLRVIRDISPDLLAAVRKAGHPYMYRRWERHNGTEIMTAEESVLSGGDSDLDSIGIRRSSLQNVLYDYALSQGISITFSKATVSARNRDDGLVDVHFADGTSRRTRVLFGADGGKSKVRSAVAGLDEPGLAYTGVTCLMGLAECPPEEKGICFPSSDREDFHAVFFPTGENEQCFQFHFPITEQDNGHLNWGNLSNEVGKEECRKLADELRSEGWHERYLEPLRNVTKAVRVGFALLEPRLKTWVNKRIVLVGDAAHPPVPYLGQGAQQGKYEFGVVGNAEYRCTRATSHVFFFLFVKVSKTLLLRYRS
jgi:salicylate hydroxylase